MASIRQNRIEGVIQEEVSIILQRQARELCLGVRAIDRPRGRF